MEFVIKFNKIYFNLLRSVDIIFGISYGIIILNEIYLNSIYL